MKPIDYVMQLSDNLTKYGVTNDVLFGLYHLHNLDNLKEFLKQLRPNNMLVMVASKGFKDEPNSLTEHWFKTQYSKVPLPANLVNYYLVAFEAGGVSDVRLLQPNQFMPRKLVVANIESDWEPPQAGSMTTKFICLIKI